MIASPSNSNDEIFDILFNSDEITWQSMIYDLVSSEQMDPWDVDVSQLSNKFLEKLKKFKETDLKISGKVLLAAAILLRVKSYRFMEEDMTALDALIASVNSDAQEELFDDELEYEEPSLEIEEQPQIFPRTPQPRKRKVSVFDLVNALGKALEVFKRRPPKAKEKINVQIPEKGRDISLVIRDVYHRVAKHFDTKHKNLNFHQLLEDDSKEEKIYTFVPLLHLENQRKLELIQENHLGEIKINLLQKPE